jgi:hypothetical protein
MPVIGQNGSGGLVRLGEADGSAVFVPFEQPVKTRAKEIATTAKLFLRTKTPEEIAFR